MWRTDWKRPCCGERLQAGGEVDNRGWDSWMASPTRWTWVWASPKSWWWTEKPGVLQSMESQRVGHDWATELTEWLQNWYFLSFGAILHNSYIQMNVILSSGFSCLGFDLTSVLTSEVNFSHLIFNILSVLLLERLCDTIFLDRENHPLRLFYFWKQSSHMKSVIEDNKESQFDYRVLAWK